MKLLKFESKLEDCIDEILMIVPDDFDKDFARQEAEDADLPGAILTMAVDIDDVAGFSDYRPYWG